MNDGQVSQSELIPIQSMMVARDQIDAIVSNPEKIGELQRELIPALMMKLAAIQNALAAQFLLVTSNGNAGIATEDEYRLITVHEAADLLSLKSNHLYDLIRRKHFPAIRLGRRYVRIRLSDLRNWISQHSDKNLDNHVYVTYSNQHDRSRTPTDKKKDGAYAKRIRGPRGHRTEQHSEAGTWGDRHTRTTGSADSDAGRAEDIKT